MNTVNISMSLQGFLALLEKEIREYDVSEDSVKLFLAMNESFCLDGIGGTGNCETIEDYVNAFVYGASGGYIEDVDGYGDDFSEKVEWCYDHCLYVDEDLKMYVESF